MPVRPDRAGEFYRGSGAGSWCGDWVWFVAGGGNRHDPAGGGSIRPGRAGVRPHGPGRAGAGRRPYRDISTARSCADSTGGARCLVDFGAKQRRGAVQYLDESGNAASNNHPSTGSGHIREASSPANRPPITPAGGSPFRSGRRSFSRLCDGDSVRTDHHPGMASMVGHDAGERDLTLSRMAAGWDESRQPTGHSAWNQQSEHCPRPAHRHSKLPRDSHRFGRCG